MRRSLPLVAAGVLALVAAGCGSPGQARTSGTSTRAKTTRSSVSITTSRSAPKSKHGSSTKAGSSSTTTSSKATTTTAAGTGRRRTDRHAGTPSSRQAGGPSRSAAGCVASSPPHGVGGWPSLDGVQFVSSQQGWVVGAGRILATTDGGHTWKTQLLTSEAFQAVDFVSPTTGWAVGHHELLGTSDGGRCWVRLGEPGQPLASVHFVSAQDGWGVAAAAPASSSPRPVPGGGILERTTDGGRTWSAVPGAPANAQSVCFVNGTDGWLGADGRIFATTDGGSSWRQVENPSDPSGHSPRQVDLETVQCAAPAGVWVVSDTDNGAAGTVPWAVFASTNGQKFAEVVQTMYNVAPRAHQAPGSYPGVTSVINPSTAAIVAFTPARLPRATAMQLASLSPGTRISPTYSLPPMQDATGAAFVSGTTGWVVGDAPPSASGTGGKGGLIMATRDGGKTWTQQYRTP